jgi:hypothetical protein
MMMKTMQTNMNQSKLRQTLAQVIRDMRYAHHQLTETDVAYDLGYMMALCYALDRKPLADALLERYERYAY